MFSRKNRQPQAIATLLGAGTLVEGDVSFKGGLHLEGRVVGEVTGDRADSVLTVGQHGVVEGAVSVSRLVLNGTIAGDVDVGGRAELGPTARVEGNLRYSVLEMAGGARVNGRLIHDKGAPRQLPAADEPATPGPKVDDATVVR
jgi:cytoskeletal protein CcmA (bactofilin family)